MKFRASLGEMIRDRFGILVVSERLRKLTAVLAQSFEPLREATQVEALVRLIGYAREIGKTPDFQ